MKDAAYKHYLATGTVHGSYWGDISRGSGPPSNPMSRDEFYAHLRGRARPDRFARAAAAELFGQQPDIVDGDNLSEESPDVVHLGGYVFKK